MSVGRELETLPLVEAKAILVSQGYVGEPTTAALVEAGWEPAAVLADIVPSGSELPADVQAACARLIAEGQANAWPAEIMAVVVPLVKTILGAAK